MKLSLESFEIQKSHETGTCNLLHHYFVNLRIFTKILLNDWCLSLNVQNFRLVEEIKWRFGVSLHMVKSKSSQNHRVGPCSMRILRTYRQLMNISASCGLKSGVPVLQTWWRTSRDLLFSKMPLLSQKSFANRKNCKFWWWKWFSALQRGKVEFSRNRLSRAKLNGLESVIQNKLPFYILVLAHCAPLILKQCTSSFRTVYVNVNRLCSSPKPILMLYKQELVAKRALKFEYIFESWSAPLVIRRAKASVINEKTKIILREVEDNGCWTRTINILYTKICYNELISAQNATTSMWVRSSRWRVQLRLLHFRTMFASSFPMISPAIQAIFQNNRSTVKFLILRLCELKVWSSWLMVW